MSSQRSQYDWYERRPWIDQDALPSGLLERKASEAALGHGLEEKLRQWRRDGVVVFENCVDRDLIRSYRQDLDWVIAHPAALPVTLGVGGEMKPSSEYSSDQLRAASYLRFYALHQFSESGRRLLMTPEIVTFLRIVFEDRPSPMSSLTFVRGSQQPVHADFAFVYKQTALAMMAACWIPLEDVHPDSGPLVYYPGSHRVETFGFYDFGKGLICLSEEHGNDVMRVEEFSDWLLDRIVAGGLEERVFLPKEGDVLIWHAALVHAGTPIKDATRTRYSLVGHYTSSAAMPSDHIKVREDGAPVCWDYGDGIIYRYPWLDADSGVPETETP